MIILLPISGFAFFCSEGAADITVTWLTEEKVVACNTQAVGKQELAT